MGITHGISEIIGEQGSVNVNQEFPAPVTIHHIDSEGEKLRIVEQLLFQHKWREIHGSRGYTQGPGFRESRNRSWLLLRRGTLIGDSRGRRKIFSRAKGQMQTLSWQPRDALHGNSKWLPPGIRRGGD